MSSAPSPTVLGPPFTAEPARLKVRRAEDAGNSRDPEQVSMAYPEGSEWRNRSEFRHGRPATRAFLAAKWQREHEHRLRTELWDCGDNRITVRFIPEWHDAAGQWWRSHGNEMWECDAAERMARRFASINDEAISDESRQMRDGAG